MTVHNIDHILIFLFFLVVDIKLLPAKCADENTVLFKVLILLLLLLNILVSCVVAIVGIVDLPLLVFDIVQDFVIEVVEIDVLIKRLSRPRRERKHGAHDVG